MSNKEAIGFYYDRRIEKTRPITARKGSKQRGKISFKKDEDLIVKALRIAEQMPNQAVSFLSSVIEKLIESGKREEAKRLLEALKTSNIVDKHSIKKLEDVANKQLKEISFRKLLEKLPLLTEEEIRDVIRKMLNEGNVEEAINIIKKLSPRVCINILKEEAKRLGYLGAHEEVLKILNTFTSDDDAMDRLLRYFILSDVAVGLLKKGKFDDAINLVKNISKKHRPAAFSRIVLAFTDAGRVDDAIKLLKEVVKCPVSCREAFGYVIGHLLKNKEVEKIKDVLNLFEKLHPVNRKRKLTNEEKRERIERDKYDIMYDAVKKALDESEISLNDLLNVFKEVKVKPPYYMIVEKLAAKGRPHEALKIVDKITDYIHKSKALRRIVFAFTLQHDFDKALEITEQISDEYLKDVTYEDIAIALIKADKTDDVLKIVEKPSNHKIRNKILEALALKLTESF
ncbi:MAG: hypothetical protein B6U95_04865 [Thermofilum sp. ex4484_82]|nr:MAG: hypothetical protein B6U95_04865 [Thermofilum sp. ex4484_82]OYT38246.1 MAG: hypothetical protein B6U96_04860 [Archaeoglobales archaeon ex4484_92]